MSKDESVFRKATSSMVQALLAAGSDDLVKKMRDDAVAGLAKARAQGHAVATGFFEDAVEQCEAEVLKRTTMSSPPKSLNEILDLLKQGLKPPPVTPEDIASAFPRISVLGSEGIRVIDPKDFFKMLGSDFGARMLTTEEAIEKVEELTTEPSDVWTKKELVFLMKLIADKGKHTGPGTDCPACTTLDKLFKIAMS